MPHHRSAPPRHKNSGIPAEPGGAESRSDVVRKGLRQAIIEQALRPGMRLPEDTIGARFRVSRTIVRAAFARLAVEGLVELRPNRGAVVASPSLEEAREIFELRSSLERLAIAQLCGRLGPDRAARLRAHVAAEEKAQGRDGPESIRLAGEFHILLAEMTGNRTLLRYVDELVSRCSLILALYGRPHSSDCAVAEHREIIAALAQKDKRAAARVCEQHLGAVANRALLNSRRRSDIQGILAPYVAE